MRSFNYAGFFSNTELVLFSFAFCLSVLNNLFTGNHLPQPSIFITHTAFPKTIDMLCTRKTRQVGKGKCTFETRNSGPIRRKQRRPHGLLLDSSKSKSFLAFLIPQLVPQLPQYKAAFRRYGRHLTVAVLLLSIGSALLLSLGWVHFQHHQHRPEGYHHANEMHNSQYFKHGMYLEHHRKSSKIFQRPKAAARQSLGGTADQSATVSQALKQFHMAHYQKEKDRILGRRAPRKRIPRAKLIMSKKLSKTSENQSQHRRSLKTVNVKWNGHLEVENGTLKAVPFTRWNFDKDMMKFTPPKQRITDVRLISLKDACFCAKRNKFVVPRRSLNKTSFPGFFYRYGAVKMVPWDKPESLLMSKTQTVTKISGRTILWRGRSLSLYQQHLKGSLIAIRSLIDIMKKKNGGPIHVAAESLIERGKRDIRTMKLQDYFLGDIPAERRIELKNLRPQMICFDQVYAVGSEYENHAMSHESYDYVKELVEMREKGRLQHRLVKSCEQGDANKKTIWILEKQQVNGHYGSMANVAEVKIGVDHEIIKAGLAKTVTAKVIQAPNIICPKGSAREGCIDLNCTEGYSKEDCIRSESMLRDVVGFNNMTFLITTSGPGNNGLVYMPRGSNVVEIAPFGVYDRVHEQAAKDAGMDYHRIENRGDRKVEERLHERFGDVARSPRTCWADSECRSVRTSRATVVDVHVLRFILRRALPKWKRTCHV